MTDKQDPAYIQRYQRLPKWAQAEIARLTSDLKTARATLSAGPEDSTVIVDPHGDVRPMGTPYSVEFVQRLPNGRPVSYEVRATHTGGLEVVTDAGYLVPFGSSAINVVRLATVQDADVKRIFGQS